MGEGCKKNRRFNMYEALRSINCFPQREEEEEEEGEFSTQSTSRRRSISRADVSGGCACNVRRGRRPRVVRGWAGVDCGGGESGC